MAKQNPSDPAPFSDNWAYVKTELQWLDRLLLLAVGRQKRDRKETDQVGSSERDRVTRHWWKGIVSLEGPPFYDDIRPSPLSAGPLSAGGPGNESVGTSPTASPGAKAQGYQQQLEQRIQASQARGIILALPSLRERLALTLFEKNLLLLGLAPEVNRRYARLYAYLQESDATQLPQLDLALKLLCRNDQEWQMARMRLASDSPLVQAGLVSFVAPDDQPLLTHSLKLSESLVNYALANPVQAEALDRLLASAPPLREGLVRSRWIRRAGLSAGEKPSALQSLAPLRDQPAPWEQLIVPQSLKQELQHLSQRLQAIALDPPPRFGLLAPAVSSPLGTFAIFYGPEGTGKTTAAQLIAQAAQTGLTRVDLRQVPPERLPQLLQDLLHQSPTALVLESAALLLGASALLGTSGGAAAPLVHQFFEQRRAQPALTIFVVRLLPQVAPQWQRQCDRCLGFALPTAVQRQQLWKQAFPPEAKLDRRIAWSQLAQQGRLSGGQIQAIARDAYLYATTAGQKTITLANIQRAWRQRYP